MSRTASPSSAKPYDMARCRMWGAARAMFYRHHLPPRAEPPRRRVPTGPMPDGALLEAMRESGHEGALSVRLQAKELRTSRSLAGKWRQKVEGPTCSSFATLPGSPTTASSLRALSSSSGVSADLRPLPVPRSQSGRVSRYRSRVSQPSPPSHSQVEQLNAAKAGFGEQLLITLSRHHAVQCGDPGPRARANVAVDSRSKGIGRVAI